ncbi:MAG TPA: PAS domain S-box protein, partial [Nitrospirota bacterium]|nr:PAS domain S-box protein [Nitrospirota bacterium]
MKSKCKTAQKKKHTGSTGAPSASRTGSGSGARRTSAQIEARFRAVFERSRDAIGVSKAGIHVFVNPAYLDLFGFPRGTDLSGKPILDLVAPESRDQVRSYTRRRVRGEEAPAIYETRGLRTDGTAFDMEVNVSSYQENGEEHTLVILRDITRRKQSESALKESEAKYRRLYNETPVLLHSIDRNGTLVEVNDYWLQTLGYERHEVIGRKVTDFYTEASRKYAEEVVQPAFFLDGIVRDIAYQFVKKNGDVVEVLLSATAERNAAGNNVRSQAVIVDITDRKRTEDLLRRSEARYRMLYQGTPVMMHSIDAEGKLVSVSDHWLRTLGYARDEVLGRRSVEFLDEQSRAYARTVVLPDFMRTGICTDVPYTFVKKNGERIFTLLSAIAERDEAGKVVRSLAVIIDITERKRAEEAVRESEERFRRLVEQSPIAISIIDGTGRVEYTNRKHIEIVGYTVEEVPSIEDWWALAYPDAAARQRIMNAWGDLSRRVLSGEDVEPVERTIVCKDGSSKNVEMRFSLAGQKILAVFADITERKRVENELRASEERFRAITITASDAILLMDDTGKIVYWNPAAGRMFGYSAEEAIGKDLHLFLGPERLHENFRRGYGNFVKTGQGPVINRSVELVAVKKDGREFPIEVSTSAMNIGGKWHALGIVRDITERKRAEQALWENQARLDLALQSAHMGVWRWEITENRRYFDGLTCQLMGIEPATFTGTAEAFFRIVHPEDREKIKAALARTIEQDVPYEPAYRIVWPDGSVHHVTARGRLVRDEKGQPARINGILWDITDQRLIEQELIKTQKLESVGTLAGGIAHDFNNLLQGIFGYISMAKLTHDQKEKSLAMLEQAEKALHQAVNLTSQLLTFSKGGKPLKKVFALGPVIENAVKFSLSGSPVVSELVLPDDLRAISADEGQIGQVIQNIVLNAEQSMPLGGRITIKAENAPASVVPSLPGEAAENYVAVSVQDQGAGISPEHLQRIFDPYFTTKEKGSGLGLATSYSIIKNHGGVITVASEPGKGSTFTIYLPASTTPAEQGEYFPERMAVRRGKILVMDDENVVRDVAGELIRALGHEVEFAEQGEAALMQYQ